VEASVQVFWVPKKGNSMEEYEDAYGCTDDGSFFAIADGATESSFAEVWAQVLTRQFVEAPPPFPPDSGSMEQWLQPLQKEWHANINWERLPWYAEEKARLGAFAAMLGMKFLAAQAVEDDSVMSKVFFMFKKAAVMKNKWQAVALGDCNLFLIRGNALALAFPLLRAEQFNSRPMLVGSNPARNKSLWPEMRFMEGEYLDQDLFILATDAIAKWFLERHEAGGKPWTTLLALKNDSDFATFVSDLREKSQIRNDDTTVIMFRWKESAPTGGQR
jgi:hypothetical protein